jgi:hypothetical protein
LLPPLSLPDHFAGGTVRGRKGIGEITAKRQRVLQGAELDEEAPSRFIRRPAITKSRCIIGDFSRTILCDGIL